MHWVKSEPTFSKYFHEDFDFLEVFFARQDSDEARMAKQLSANPFQVHSEWPSGGQRKLLMMLDSETVKQDGNGEGGSSPTTSGKSSVISQWENRSVVSAENADSIHRINGLVLEQDQTESQPETNENEPSESNFHDMSKPLPPPTVTPSAAAKPTATDSGGRPIDDRKMSNQGLEWRMQIDERKMSNPDQEFRTQMGDRKMSNPGQELNNEVAAMMNAPSSPAVRRSVVQLESPQTTAANLSLRPPTFKWSEAVQPRPRLSSSACTEASSAATAVSQLAEEEETRDDEFSSEYSNHSEKDPTEVAFEDEDGFKMCTSDKGTEAIKAIDASERGHSCDKENCEPSDQEHETEQTPAAAAPQLPDVATTVQGNNPIWIISPDQDKPKKKRNKKKKKVEKDT